MSNQQRPRMSAESAELRALRRRTTIWCILAALLAMLAVAGSKLCAQPRLAAHNARTAWIKAGARLGGTSAADTLLAEAGR